MQRLEEWPSSTEFGLQAACNVAPVFRQGGPEPPYFHASLSPSCSANSIRVCPIQKRLLARVTGPT
jgi:hypothetical protein